MALSIAPALAADRVLSPVGVIHSVSVESRSGANALPASGTKLVYRLQSGDETLQSTVIPGTDEPVVDSEPTILLSPVTYTPAVVWTRNEGSAAEITYSFYNGSAWSPATSLTQNAVVDRHPQIFWGSSGYLHIVWTGVTTTDGPLMYEAVLDSKGFVVLPPATVHTSPGAIVTTNSAAGPILNTSDVLLLVDTSYKVTNRVTAQGGYDEPIPVSRRVDFIIPSGSAIESSKIDVVNGRILVLVKSGTRMYYAYQSMSAGWTTLRSLTLDSVTDDRAAEITIKGMLATLGP